MEWLRVPLINASEHELDVRAVEVREGQLVQAGQLLCVIESTKAAMELEAPTGGYIRALAVAAGTVVRVGDLVCAITATRDEPLETKEPRAETGAVTASACMPALGEVDRPVRDAAPARSTAQVEATDRARRLAAEHGLDLESLGVEGIVRAHHVERALGVATRAARSEAADGLPRIVVLGAGGHARAVVDLIRASRPDLQLVGALDDGPTPPRDVLGVPVLGGSRLLARLRDSGVAHAALGVGAVRDNTVRERLYSMLLEAGFGLPSLIHPRATVERSATLGHGNQVFAGAVVGANVRLADDIIVNSNAVLSHDCIVESHAHVTPGAILAGAVRVGRGAVIGMGATIYIGLQIGAYAVVPNGTAVFRDIEGVAVEPAQLLRP